VPLPRSSPRIASRHFSILCVPPALLASKRLA
jgi:hypothetical protein